MKKRPKIVFVGGGSHAWVPNLVKDMMYHPALTDSEIVLYDINREAAEFCKTFIEKINQRLAVNPKVIATNNRNMALKNADYVVIMIAVGGLQAMAQDLKIPESYGIYHTVGDSTGPGGWIRAIRHFQTFRDLAESIKKLAPGAMVLNYTNPMAMLTDILARICDGPVVGLCHGVFDNIHFIRDAYKLESEDEVHIHYGGINHFIWFTKASAGPVDVIADLKKKLKTRSLDDIKHGPHVDAMGFSSHSEIATELFRLTGIMPYIGDRHTCEFFPWYITSRNIMKKYNLVRTSVTDRRKKGQQRLKRYQSWVKSGKIPDHVFCHSRETAANIIDAHFTGVPFVDVGNVPNAGQIQNLPPGSIVETAVRFDRNGATPLTFGMLPDVVEAMIRPWTAVYKMLIDACFAGDRSQAIEALRLDPVCSHLNCTELLELAKRLLDWNRDFIRFEKGRIAAKGQLKRVELQ